MVAVVVVAVVAVAVVAVVEDVVVEDVVDGAEAVEVDGVEDVEEEVDGVVAEDGEVVAEDVDGVAAAVEAGAEVEEAVVKTTPSVGLAIVMEDIMVDTRIPMELDIAVKGSKAFPIIAVELILLITTIVKVDTVHNSSPHTTEENNFFNLGNL